MKCLGSLAVFLLTTLINGSACAHGSHRGTGYGGHGGGGRNGIAHGIGGRTPGKRIEGARGSVAHMRSPTGITVGSPIISPSWYYTSPPPAWYPYPDDPLPGYGDTVVHTAPQAPPEYVEQGTGAAIAPDSYWYLCPKSKAYYPYVKDCPGGWVKETPRITRATPAASVDDDQR